MSQSPLLRHGLLNFDLLDNLVIDPVLAVLATAATSRMGLLLRDFSLYPELRLGGLGIIVDPSL
jgi:hypothetical protein